MAVTREEARRELARRELERRRAVQPTDAPITQFNDPRGAVLPLASEAIGLPGWAGIAGLAAGMVPGGESPSEKANRYINQVRGFFAPPNPASANVMESVGNAAEGVSRGVRAPFAGVATANLEDPGSTAERLAYEDYPESQRAEVRREITEGGIGPFMGDTAAEMGAPPWLSAGLETAPSAAALFAGQRSVVPKSNVPGTFIPSVKDLYGAGRVAFNEARLHGGGIKPEVANRFMSRLQNLKNDVGLQERFSPSVTPKAHGLRQEIIDDIAGGQFDFDSLMELRQLAGRLAGDVDKAEARLGMALKNEIDGFINNIKPSDVISGNPQRAAQALETANKLWRDASAAREIETRIQLARDAASNFTGSGFENALRREFIALKKRITKGQEKGFTPEEVKLITAVAEGSPIGNIFRFFGKSAPTGIVSGGLAFGLPAMAGNPLLGAALVGTGAIGRKLATNSTIRNAQRALEQPLKNSLINP